MPGVAAGVRILDFTWFAVGPLATKYLADNGAEVVRVESMKRPDGIRLAPPWKDATPGVNRSQFFGNLNSSKKSIRLNLQTTQGRDLARELVPHFDVVTDSYTAGTMTSWGLGYDDLCKLKPDVIQLSTCMQGQTGPNSSYPGFGSQMASLCGFHNLTGYSDEEIAPSYGAYTDFVVHRYACFTLLAALDHRRRTGEGQFIDLSQYEAALHFMAPALTDYLATGTVIGPQANKSERYSPHGAYRCRDEDGEERWVALAVESDTEWRSLVDVLGGGASTEAFSSQSERMKRAGEVDSFVQDLIIGRYASDVAGALQQVGVAAYPVQSCLDLRADENLEAFGFWPWLEQTECGSMPYDGLAYRLCRTPGQQTAAPNIGEHTEEILEDLLGLTTAKIHRLVEEEVLY